MHTQNKSILHIANDYTGSTVYKNLALELDKLNVRQIIYTPFRGQNKIGNNEINFQMNGSKIIYSPILNWHIDRLFYPYKIFKILKDIQLRIDLKKINYIHAHTWYSDGGVAYFLSKKYNIPFVITIRNTDLNIFQKKLVYLRPLGRKILIDAKHIFLVSASYENRLLNQHSLKQVISNIKNKIRIIPNGVDPYWIKNSFYKNPKGIDKVFNILYVGKFTASKQILLLQEAIIQLNRELSRKIILHIVGEGGKDEIEVLKKVNTYSSSFKYYGKVYDKTELQKIFKSCDVFAMPSKYETFGLVYIEAMLQGLPVLYSDGEGIDGFYSEKIGEKVRKHTVKEIKQKLRIMINNFEQYSIPLEKVRRNHDWGLIAREYKEIYEENTDMEYSINN